MCLQESHIGNRKPLYPGHPAHPGHPASERIANDRKSLDISLSTWYPEQDLHKYPHSLFGLCQFD